ncbi:MAG: MBL fold metallo-hydrolase [Saccharolobus sp.]|jgi:putative mRNA 3-end processing factor|uniref:MBL fold metallo-hydrolase n=1 Tax=Saccharolobus sp. TaxID=2100761 RepID=UPI0028CF622B|nr:MBL fold metallo-hydrolase [Saccharolobus sp.]MDT7861438.1 MBL fold metallo-hydrolase [Saccharolobus sp.]
MNYFLKILGGGREVGRSAIEIGNGDYSVVMDYGVNFDEKDNPNFPLQEQPNKVKGFIISHAHLDHVGALPIYQIGSLNTKIYGTVVSRVITEVMLKDFLKLSGPKVPYEWIEVRKAMDNFIAVNYGEEFEIGGFKAALYNAGHIPGSAIIKVITEKQIIAFTGDINLTETKLMKPADLNGLKDVNVLVMESTYGKFNHPSRREVEDEFYEKVLEVVEGGGTVLVPAFSLARSQEILSVLAERNFPYPVYYDGMSRELTEIMLGFREFLNRPDLLKKAYDEFHYVKGWEDRHRAWKDKGVIVASAGMLKGGPAVYYFKKLSENSKNAIFLVSYQAINTPGRKLLEMGKFDEYSPLLKARLEIFDFSSHAGRRHLLDIVKASSNIEKVVLVHGSPDNEDSLADLIRREIGVDVITPENGQEISL